MASINVIRPRSPAKGLESVNKEIAAIAAIEAKMGTKKYFKDEAMQKKYRDLINERRVLRGSDS